MEIRYVKFNSLTYLIRLPSSMVLGNSVLIASQTRVLHLHQLNLRPFLLVTTDTVLKNQVIINPIEPGNQAHKRHLSTVTNLVFKDLSLRLQNRTNNGIVYCMRMALFKYFFLSFLKKDDKLFLNYFKLY